MHRFRLGRILQREGKTVRAPDHNQPVQPGTPDTEPGFTGP